MVEMSDEMTLLWPPSWQGLQQQIVYLAQFGNSVQVIHGDSGAGKTTFFNRLLHSDFGRSAVGVQAEGHGSIEFFFRSILTQFGLRPDPLASRGELIAALRGFVQTLHKERSRAVLLIDDAHALSDPELGALLSLLQGHTDAGVGLHMVMFAQPGFAARLDALGVLDVEIHDAPMPPLSPQEVLGLLQKLEPRVGPALNPSDHAQRMWNQSRGLPGKILELVEQLRPIPAMDKALALRGLPIGHFAALVLLSGILVWAFLVRHPAESPQTQATPLPVPLVIPAVQNPEAGGPTASDRAIVDTAPAPSPDASNPQMPSLAQESPAVSEILESPAVDTATQVLAPTEPPAVIAGPNLDLQDADKEAPITIPAPKNESPPKAREMEQPGPRVQSGKITGKDVGAQELLRLPASGYALQLMAASTAATAEAYIAQQPNRKNLRMYRGTRDGKTFYIVVEGFYADKAAAQAAIINLPEHQRRAGPWPKPLEHIQREIRANRS